MKGRGRKKRLGAKAAAGPSTAVAAGPSLATDPELAHRRLSHLYEISKLFTSFENVDQTLAPVLALVAQTLPLRSVVLMEQEEGHARVVVWPAENESPAQRREAREHAEWAFGYLVGTRPPESGAFRPPAGGSGLPRPAQPGALSTNRFIVIPLVVSRRPPFGTLQVEAAHPLDRADLGFVNAIANQLAIALDRDRAWRRDITRRQHAEQGWTEAEARGASAERERASAETASEHHAALAAENARLYVQARQAVAEREQLLAIVSHDLKDPLATILMSLDALALQPGGALPAGRIRRAAERMLRLIGDLLDFASIEAGRLGIERKVQAAAPLAHETLASFEGAAKQKQLRLSAELAPGLPELCCDRDRILQVLSNLVGNATKVTAEGGHVTLRVEQRGPELLFAVSDSGPGLSEEDLRHLFERYWRSGEARYKGTGLGLAIAQGIVRAHGGRIWAQSEQGRGATFLFTLPVLASGVP